MTHVPLAGLDGPSTPVRVEPVKIPETAPAPLPEPVAPPVPAPPAPVAP